MRELSVPRQRTPGQHGGRYAELLARVEAQNRRLARLTVLTYVLATVVAVIVVLTL